ncbi:MAG: leucyl/phenylalanyl-tRNA--protein transferase [Piscirickettsiaceae bacterium]|nr:leucyl/phenylalanyl-tRNA--protein transferase [Piscirickettsiaceae bacterium]
MSLTWLAEPAESPFPPIEQAFADGLLAAGGDLSASRLINAYQHGIFPWFNKNNPILWWSPDPRMVLLTNEIKISRSLKKSIRSTDLTITMDQAFNDVMTACAAPRADQNNDSGNDTWIHPSMINAYTELHQQGIAHSIECWQQEKLVGGLYGISLGNVFFGESMFSLQQDSSKIALVALCQQLQRWNISLIDCQIHSDHLASLGAKEIIRSDFISYIDNETSHSHQNKQWQLDSDLPLIT